MGDEVRKFREAFLNRFRFAPRIGDQEAEAQENVEPVEPAQQVDEAQQNVEPVEPAQQVDEAQQDVEPGQQGGAEGQPRPGSAEGIDSSLGGPNVDEKKSSSAEKKVCDVAVDNMQSNAAAPGGLMQFTMNFNFNLPAAGKLPVMQEILANFFGSAPPRALTSASSSQAETSNLVQISAPGPACSSSKVEIRELESSSSEFKISEPECSSSKLKISELESSSSKFKISEPKYFSSKFKISELESSSSKFKISESASSSSKFNKPELESHDMADVDENLPPPVIIDSGSEEEHERDKKQRLCDLAGDVSAGYAPLSALLDDSDESDSDRFDFMNPRKRSKPFVDKSNLTSNSGASKKPLSGLLASAQDMLHQNASGSLAKSLLSRKRVASAAAGAPSAAGSCGSASASSSGSSSTSSPAPCDEEIANAPGICRVCRLRPVDSLLACMHAFCHECLKKWKEAQRTCPVCRKPFRKWKPFFLG